MTYMEFEYFRHPDKFAFKVDKPTPCSISGEVAICFDAGGYPGINDIDCICSKCLKTDALIEFEIESNMNFDDGSEAAKTITYKTPDLPTWQDTVWPMIECKFPVFECITSLEDFADEEEFSDSFVEKTIQ